MDLYVIRHAWAGHFGDPEWPDDSQRPLTPDGMKRFARMVEILTDRGFQPQIIATSPWGDGPAYPVQQLVVGIDGTRVTEAALFAWSDSAGGFTEIARLPGAEV